MRNNFPKRPLHSLSKFYDVPVGFVPPVLISGSVLLYLQLPKGGCCLISDDLSCSCKTRMYQSIEFHVLLSKIVLYMPKRFIDVLNLLIY